MTLRNEQANESMRSANAGLDQMGRSVGESESLRIERDKEQRVTSGFNGPYGFVSYPGLAACGKTFAEWLAGVEQEARIVGETRTGLGEASGLSSVARGTDSVDWERVFTRNEVLTVLKAQKATWRDEPTEAGGIRYRAALDALEGAMGIFERME